MKNFYILGNPIKHSLSPMLFNYIFSTLNINAQYLSYKCLNTNILKSFLINNINNYSGINITLPFKINAYQIVDDHDLSAKNIKAVNCINNINNRLVGYNTDVYGFKRMIKNIDINIKDYDILILGNGGAARSVLSVLHNYTNNDIFIWGRNTSKVNSFIKDFYSSQVKFFNNNANKSCIVINCLSLDIGNCSIKSILNKISSINMELFIDLNYFETLLSKTLKEKKYNVILAHDMFIFQALKSFDIWFNNKYHNKITYDELKTLLKNEKN